VLSSCPDFELCRTAHSISDVMELLRQAPPNLLILDKAFGAQAVLDCLAFLKGTGRPTATVIWGVSVTDAEALRYLQAGARGIIHKTAELHTLLVCLRSVAAGATWMDQTALRGTLAASGRRRAGLTPRERQVLELVEQGLKNREIASELGIRPGTVKVHVKHIFEKTGVRGRYGLALSGLADRDTPAASRG